MIKAISVIYDFNFSQISFIHLVMMIVLLLRKYEQPKQNAFQNHLNYNYLSINQIDKISKINNQNILFFS